MNRGEKKKDGSVWQNEEEEEEEEKLRKGRRKKNERSFWMLLYTVDKWNNE